MISHDGSYDRHGKVVHKPYSNCISSVENLMGTLKFSLSIAEQRAAGFIPAWSLAFLQVALPSKVRLVLVKQVNRVGFCFLHCLFLP